jgi:hypothetical protein
MCDRIARRLASMASRGRLPRRRARPRRARLRRPPPAMRGASPQAPHHEPRSGAPARRLRVAMRRPAQQGRRSRHGQASRVPSPRSPRRRSASIRSRRCTCLDRSKARADQSGPQSTPSVESPQDETEIEPRLLVISQRLRDTSIMTAGWNFERRRDTCAAFVIGVFEIVNGRPDRDTSLEAVRNRMRLSPEEALFAARRLNSTKRSC